MDLTEKWEEIITKVQKEHEVSNTAVDTWLRPLEVYGVEGDAVYILVPSDKMFYNYVVKRYLLPLKVAIAEVTGHEYEVRMILPEDAKKLNMPSGSGGDEGEKGDLGADHLERMQKLSLNPNYTFKTFVSGSSNKFALAAAEAVTKDLATTFNPLFIYGGPGLGKTHLIHAIGNKLIEDNPDIKIIYVTSEEFTNEVIESIRSGNASAMNKFREKYRTIDVLMIDDVQFIIGKESTQEEFFHTFNTLYSANKQIILTSDKPPKEMVTLEERIRSRFEWGLMTEIGTPTYETRMAILRQKVEAESMKLDDEILDYIATYIKSNIRELEGALNKLLAIARLEKTDITLDLAKKELQNIITPDKKKEITAQLIIEKVSEHFEISIDQMISKSRSKDVTRPRHIAMYLCKNMTDTSLDAIGTLLGGRDHSTIIHGIQKITEEYESDQQTRNLIETLKKKINAD